MEIRDRSLVLDSIPPGRSHHTWMGIVAMQDQGQNGMIKASLGNLVKLCLIKIKRVEAVAQS